MKKLRKLIYSMLITSTGTALCDSGGENGRNWQQNQKRTLKDFENDKPVDLDYELPCNTSDIIVTVSVFHYLINILELDSICNEFNELSCKDWNSDKAYGLSTSQANWLEQNGFEFGRTWNSSNHDSNLSQVLQGCNLTLNDEEYFLIQIHQGADVRGGYTDAKLFKLQEWKYFTCNGDVNADVETEKDNFIELTNSYNGYGLTDDNGNDIDLKEGYKITAFL